MLQMATVVMLRLLLIMLGLQLMIKLMMAMMTVMHIVVTIAALVTRAAHIVHHGNSHQNVNKINLHANEMHKECNNSKSGNDYQEGTGKGQILL